MNCDPVFILIIVLFLLGINILAINRLNFHSDFIKKKKELIMHRQ